MAVVNPPTWVFDAINAPTTQVTSRAEIWNSDGTMFMREVPVISGAVTVDQTRDERRGVDMVLSNHDQKLDNYPGGFWYDKLIRVFRGISHPIHGKWEVQLGEFMIDQITTQDFPSTMAVTGRDLTKKLLKSGFPYTTTFTSGQTLEALVKTIATNGGINPNKMILPVTGKTVARDITYDTQITRWGAIKELAESYGYEVFFDNAGFLVMQTFRDPTTTGTVYTFRTGIDTQPFRPSPYTRPDYSKQGNVLNFTKRTSDARIYNHVVVTGGATDTAPVGAEAKNEDPKSPTNIAKLGPRIFRYESAFITTTAQAQDVANARLKLVALEEFELSLTSIVVPWLEVGEIVQFIDPDPNPGDPSRYLLSSFSIPLRMGTMNPVGKRITNVG